MLPKNLPIAAALGLAAVATLASAAPQGLNHQIVLASEPAAPAPAAAASHREPDFIDILEAEAKKAGVKLDLGLDHVQQKAQEGVRLAHKEAHAHAQHKQPHADELLAQHAAEGDEEWDHSVLPESDLEELAAMEESAQHAAEMYVHNSQAAVAAARKMLDSMSFKFTKPSTAALGKAVPSGAKAQGEPGSGWIWKSCGLGEEVVTVNSIDVKPDPPKPGQNMTVHGTGLVKTLVDDGTYVDVTVKIGLIKLLSRRFDVCQEAKENNAEVQCPVKPGEYDISQTVALPREIPPAKFNVHVTGSTQEDLDLLCLDLSINFMRI